MDINSIQDKIIEEFETLSDKISKFTYFRYLINLSKKQHKEPPADKSQLTLVKGIKSTIQIRSYFEKGKVYFKAESDSPVAGGLANLLLKVYSGNAPATIANTDLYFLYEIGLYNHLTSAWQNDFMSVLKHIKSIAVRYQLRALK